ncbi:MAG: hypothetical protein AB7W59_00170 [Acidimicrobiia bacterium]
MAAYITVADIRAAGLTDDTTYPDAAVTAAIDLWQQVLERACRQWFDSRNLTLKLDGTDSDTLHVGIPIISLEYLKINDHPDELNPSYYRVYNGRSYPDDRRNPRIKLRSLSEVSDIYSAPLDSHMLRFRKGRHNQEVKGDFGFVEDDGSTPLPIKRALTKLVIEKLVNPIPIPGAVPPVPPPPIVAGALLEEWTDGHRVKYADVFKFTESRPSPYLGITQDQEILTIIRLYRAPLGMAAPAHPSYM